MINDDTLTNNLPQYDTPFIGRNEDTTAIVALLADPAVRWLSLIGSSGTGKTRLALHVAEQVSHLFPDGIYFVSFAAITNPEYILSTIAQSLGTHEVGSTPLIDTLVQTLSDQAMLLILDNVEQIPKLSSIVAPLLERTQQVKFLITSQKPTKQAHENLYEVPALGMPNNYEMLSVEELLSYPAIALFVDRFQTHQPDFVFSKANAQYVVDICKRVRGLPLALELISACSTSLSVADLVFLLKNYLAIGQWATNSRDRILSPVLDWCCSRLSADSQTVLSVFGAFVGGCTTESMQSICQAVYPTINVEQALATLTDRHLILLETLPNHTPRYIMLDAIVEYTGHLFNKLKQRKELLESHKTFFVDFAELGYPKFAGPEHATWNVYFADEQHNFRAVLQRLNDPTLINSPSTLIQLCGALARFWFYQGQFSEGLGFSNHALKADHADTLLTARLYQGMGILAYGKTQLDLAKQYYLQALDLREQLGDEAGAAMLRSNLSLIAMHQADYTEAKSLLIPSLEIWRKLDRTWDEAHALTSLGIIATEEEEYDQALQYFNRALEIAKQLNDPIGTANLYANLGGIAIEQGKYDQAKQYYEQSLELSKSSADTISIPFTLATLGYIALKQNDIATAERYYLQAGHTIERTSETFGSINIFEGFASLKAAQQDFALAANILGFADTLRERLALPRQRTELKQCTDVLTTLHAHLSDDQFAQFVQEGSTWDQATVLAQMGINLPKSTE